MWYFERPTDEKCRHNTQMFNYRRFWDRLYFIFMQTSVAPLCTHFCDQNSVRFQYSLAVWMHCAALFSCLFTFLLDSIQFWRSDTSDVEEVLHPVWVLPFYVYVALCFEEEGADRYSYAFVHGVQFYAFTQDQGCLQRVSGEEQTTMPCPLCWDGESVKTYSLTLNVPQKPFLLWCITSFFLWTGTTYCVSVSWNGCAFLPLQGPPCFR